MSENNLDFVIPEEKKGLLPRLYLVFVGFLIGWAITYLYYNAGQLDSVKDSALTQSFCEKLDLRKGG